MKKNDLAHHGIKGQKWGIRRYQNPDGSLTDAGRKRYGADLQKRTGRYERKVQAGYNRLRDNLHNTHINENAAYRNYNKKSLIKSSYKVKGNEKKYAKAEQKERAAFNKWQNEQKC